MSDDCMSQTPPSPEHEKLQKSIGQWIVDCKFFMGPDAPPTETKGKEQVESVGPYWVRSKFECDFMGQPFEGRCQVGYDPIKGKFISTWIDQMSPHIFVLEGNFDESGKTLNLRGKGPDHQGGITDYRMEEVHHGPDHRTASMYMATPAGEMKSFEMDYRRA